MPTTRPILGVSFDLWDTLVSYSPSTLTRLRAFRASLLARFTDADAESCDVELRSIERDEAVPAVDGSVRALSVPERAGNILKRLGRTDLDAATVAEGLASAAVQFPFCTPMSARACLAHLAVSLPLTLVSNTRWSSGYVLRQLLSMPDIDILRFFVTVVFSDEYGRAKPDPTILTAAWAGTGISADQTVHIGDRPAEDVRAILTAGGRAILAKTLRRKREPGELEHCEAVLLTFAALPGLLRYMTTPTHPFSDAGTLDVAGARLPVFAGRVHRIEDGARVSGRILIVDRPWPTEPSTLSQAGCVVINEGARSQAIIDACSAADVPIVVARRDCVALSSGQLALIDTSAGVILRLPEYNSE